METVLSYFCQLGDNETLPVLELIQREFLTSVGEPWLILYSKMAAGLAAIIFGCRALFLTLWSMHGASRPWKVKPLQESLKPAFFLTASIFSNSEHIPNEFMVSVTGFKSFSTQHHVCDVNYCPILIKIGNKKGYTRQGMATLWLTSLLCSPLCPQFLGTDPILPSSTLLYWRLNGKLSVSKG